jgi:hypothetical protein
MPTDSRVACLVLIQRAYIELAAMHTVGGPVIVGYACSVCIGIATATELYTGNHQRVDAH